MENHELQDIVLKVREGNQTAFTVLYDNYWWKVYHFTKLYILSDKQSEEIVQDVFIKLWESRATIDETKSLDGYLFMITRNTVFNFNRGRSFNEESLEVTMLNGIEESYSMEDEFMASDLHQYIHDLIEQMPPQRKRIFKMSREEGLTNAEIAERCGISPKAVERSMTLALKFLKDSLILFLVFEEMC